MDAVVLIYRSCLRATQKIRVWRSLVSRLNGVQEAAGSNPVTRTKKWELPFGNSHFLFCGWIRTHSNATCRWHVAGRRSRRRPHIYFHSPRNENANRIRHSVIYTDAMEFFSMAFLFLALLRNISYNLSRIIP